ncbi:hypothetical protein [Variovorax sp. PMC12]|uniref:hypothetical protein n=1 Tax=Variovorax sp. PMC12 TaxID=2126319 RepID=UPI000D11EA41|nr:hypothetical protein [Variovorax sp. PMC12]AVQ81641.1 hypothetical protein C4F17_12165 [Variovorax sp. PMC12]
MEDEIKALREELTRLRERVAVLESEAARSRPIGIVDWSRPVHVGSPRFVQAGPLPPGTITCGALHG